MSLTSPVSPPAASGAGPRPLAAPFRALLAQPEVLARYERPRPRYTSYPTAVDFTPAAGPAEFAERLERISAEREPLSLYVHLPFCESRCTYCACNVTISRLPGRVSPPYLRRLQHEAERVRDRAGRRLRIAQLHLGGGTPTYHTPDELRSLVDGLERTFDFDADLQASIEIDPRVTTVEHLEALAGRGFRRLSMGVQDFDPVVQEAIGRIQTVRQTRELLEAARRLGFDSINFDLVYGLPHQNETSFERTLELVGSLGPDRLAVYGFAWLPAQVRHQRAIDASTLPAAADRLALALQARTWFLANGWEAIGFDHFARPTDGLVRARRDGTLGRTFMGYTEMPTEEWLGLGSSAISSVGGAYFQNHTRLVDWQRAIDAGSHPVARGVVLTRDDQERAWVIRELMCNGGVDHARWAATWGTSFGERFAAELERLRVQWPELVHEPGDRLALTDLGELFVRNVAQAFDARHPPRDGAWSGASGV